MNHLRQIRGWKLAPQWYSHSGNSRPSSRPQREWLRSRKIQEVGSVRARSTTRRESSDAEFRNFASPPRFPLQANPTSEHQGNFFGFCVTTPAPNLPRQSASDPCFCVTAVFSSTYSPFRTEECHIRTSEDLLSILRHQSDPRRTAGRSYCLCVTAPFLRPTTYDLPLTYHPFAPSAVPAQSPPSHKAHRRQS
jgi:hypothetical protein